MLTHNKGNSLSCYTGRLEVSQLRKENQTGFHLQYEIAVVTFRPYKKVINFSCSQKSSQKKVFWCQSNKHAVL